MNVEGKHYRTVWLEGATVKMIDQPLIPHRFEIVDREDYHATPRSIDDRTLPGAPAIGAAGAYRMPQPALTPPAAPRRPAPSRCP